MTQTELQNSLRNLLPERIPVLVVDDDQSVLDVTRLVLSRYRFEQRSVEFVPARSAADAERILEERDDIAVIFLDVVMEEDDAGLTLVEHIRNHMNNQRVRIILRTGQAGFAPEYRVVQNYDINDYLAKSESTQERLYVSLTTALRGYRDILASDLFATRAAAAEQESAMAARALEEKSRFLAHLSHEIRNPLTGMIGIIELLAEASQQEQTELLESLDFTTQTLLGVVDDVLDVAKIEAGKLRLQQQSFNVRYWLEKAVSTYAAIFRQKKIHLDVDIAQELPPQLIGDPARLRQILSNFLSNAARFTPEYGTVSVRLTGTEREGKLMFFMAVADSGVGISPDRLTHIFKPYEQESESTSQMFGGTGLGLSLCHDLAELMQGEVGVVSRQSKGSTFWLEAPLKRAEDQAGETHDAVGQLKVLICEDDATNQKTLQVILEKKGLMVSVFNNGQELLSSDKWRDADAIIMDCHMPELDGMETTRRLRALDCHIPVLALTAGVTDSERHDCFDAGMDCVISKPVDFGLLHEQIVARVRDGRHPIRIAQ